MTGPTSLTPEARLAALLNEHSQASDPVRLDDRYEVDCECGAVVTIPHTATWTEAWNEHLAARLLAAGVTFQPAPAPEADRA